MSQQLGHADASITLRVYAHYLPDGALREVDRLDATPAPMHPDASQAHPAASEDDRASELSPLERVVTLTFASWNQLDGWLRQMEELGRAA